MHQRRTGDAEVRGAQHTQRSPPAEVCIVDLRRHGLHLGGMVVIVHEAQPRGDHGEEQLLLRLRQVTALDAFPVDDSPILPGPEQQTDGLISAYGQSSLILREALHEGSAPRRLPSCVMKISSPSWTTRSGCPPVSIGEKETFGPKTVMLMARW